MDPGQLMEMCLDAIQRWNAKEQLSDEPTIMLVVPKARCPRGDTVALFGAKGPRGRVATIKESPTGYDVVAYFPAIGTLKTIAEALGMKLVVEKPVTGATTGTDRGAP